MGTFGKYLLKKGVVKRAQLEEATQVMVVFGGRLGTILVEAGHLTLEEVEKHLSAYLDVPCAPAQRLARPDPEALALITADVARRHSLLPIWIEKRTLHVAMLDARDPNRIDELAFSTGLSIAPYVIGERRLVDLLERYYGIRPDPRFTDYRILEMAGHYRSVRERVEAQASGDAGIPTGSRAASSSELDQTARERMALGIGPLEQGEELSDPQESGSLLTVGTAAIGAEPIELTDEVAQRDASASPQAAPGSGRVTAPRLQPARDVAELARLEAELVFLADRERLAALALRIATFFARTVALFAVRDPMIQGVLAAGEVETECIEGIYLPLASDSMLARTASSSVRFRGPPPSESIDGGILHVLRGGVPSEAAVLPVCLGGRVVNLIYADNGADPLAETSLAALEALCDTIGAAYTRLVVEGKKRHC